MDKLFKTSKDFETVCRLLEAINRTTDDYIFVFDIIRNETWYFGNIE